MRLTYINTFQKHSLSTLLLFRVIKITQIVIAHLETSQCIYHPICPPHHLKVMASTDGSGCIYRPMELYVAALHSSICTDAGVFLQMQHFTCAF